MKPNHNGRCGCRPPAQILVARVMGSAREWLRRWCTCLEVTGVDPCARAPFTLEQVCAQTPQPVWEHGCLMLRIPLECIVRDCTGACFEGMAIVTLKLHPHLCCPEAECWCYQWLASACARLACAAPCSANLCFEAVLEVNVQAYLVKWETCTAGKGPEPSMPQLPLYPPPCGCIR